MAKTPIIATNGAGKWADAILPCDAYGALNKKGLAAVNDLLGDTWYSIWHIDARLSVRNAASVPYSKALRELADEIEKQENKQNR